MVRCCMCAVRTTTAQSSAKKKKKIVRHGKLDINFYLTLLSSLSSLSSPPLPPFSTPTSQVCFRGHIASD